LLCRGQAYDVPKVKRANDPALRSWWLDPPDIH
jgi:hypothetical protein